MSKIKEIVEFLQQKANSDRAKYLSLNPCSQLPQHSYYRGRKEGIEMAIDLLRELSFQEEVLR